MKTTIRLLPLLALLGAALACGCNEDPNIRARHKAEQRAAQAARERNEARKEVDKLRQRLAAKNPWWHKALWIIGGCAIGGVVGVGIGTGLTKELEDRQ